MALMRLDDDFLERVGLAALPQSEKNSFLEHVYSTLELRVGTSLSDGLDYYQLKEFESIIDRDESVVINWLEENAPNFQSDPLFRNMMNAKLLAEDDPNLIFEYCSTKWLEVNRPDYSEVCKAELQAIEKEIYLNKEQILDSVQRPESTGADGTLDVAD